MKKSKKLHIVVVLIAGLCALPGCAKKSAVQVMPEAGSQAETTSALMPGETREQASAAPEPESRPEMEQKEQAAIEGLKPVYFNFDQSAIRDEERTVLQANAAWLRANPEARIRIEGNCDELGTKEYNLALGQRRAANARKYLADLGIADGRIGLISYGKEKPVCTDQTEECMQKNRRGDFVVTESKLSEAD